MEALTVPTFATVTNLAAVPDELILQSNFLESALIWCFEDAFKLIYFFLILPESILVLLICI